MKNISLLTGNLQPKGHPFFVDEKTLDGAAALLAERPLAANVSHDGAKSTWRSPAGFFQGIYRDGLQLRARTFEFLDSFKANFKASYETIAELAEKFPDQFGVSLHLKYKPVWVLQDGSEVPAKVVDGLLAEGPPPKAVRPIPSARVTAVPSGDFVTSPAANLTGLLSCLLAEIDNHPSNNMSDKKPAPIDQATLDAKLAEQAQILTSELTTAHKAALDEVSAKLAEAQAAQGDLTAKLTEATAAKTTAEAALAARDTEITATLSAVGVKVEKFDPAALKAALDTRISSEAQAFLAARGMKPLPETLKHAGEIDAKLSEKDILAAYEAMPAGPERIAFLEKHEKAIWAAQTAR